MMAAIPVTLVTAAAMVALNMWLGMRIARLRGEFKVSVGDGGREPLLRRMRAQANFIENAPFFVLLVAALELSGADRRFLAGFAAVFIVARISHAVGMDKAENRRWRMYGMMGTTLAMVALAAWALGCAFELYRG
jgi:uncharacterized protein